MGRVHFKCIHCNNNFASLLAVDSDCNRRHRDPLPEGHYVPISPASSHDPLLRPGYFARTTSVHLVRLIAARIQIEIIEVTTLTRLFCIQRDKGFKPQFLQNRGLAKSRTSTPALATIDGEWTILLHT